MTNSNIWVKKELCHFNHNYCITLLRLVLIIYDYLRISNGVHQRWKMGHFYKKSIITQITENRCRDTVGCLLYSRAFTSRRRFCSGLGWCTWETQGPVPDSCVLLQDGQGQSLNRLTRRGVSSLPQSGRLRKNCNGSISEPSAFQTVVSNVAYSIPCAPCRGVVPAVHWTPGVILDVLITQCHHSDQPL